MSTSAKNCKNVFPSIPWYSLVCKFCFMHIFSRVYHFRQHLSSQPCVRHAGHDPLRHFTFSNYTCTTSPKPDARPLSPTSHLRPPITSKIYPPSTPPHNFTHQSPAKKPSRQLQTATPPLPRKHKLAKNYTPPALTLLHIPHHGFRRCLHGLPE